MRGALLQQPKTEEGNHPPLLETMLNALKHKGIKLSKPLKHLASEREAPLSRKHTLIITNNNKPKIQLELKIYQ